MITVRNFCPFLICFAMLVAGCGVSLGAEEEQEQRRTVRVEVLGRTDIEHVLRYVADLKPYAEVKIFSPVPDRILHFPWENGDEIKRHQRVALIRKEGIDKGLEQIVAQMEALDVQIKNAEAELERSRGLLAAGVITRQVFDQVQTGYLAALAQRKALEAGRGQMAVTASNAVILAPMDGVIANKMLEKGDMAIPQMPLCTIMAIDRLKVNLDLVETDVPKVHVGQKVHIRLDAYPKRDFTGELTRIMPYMNAATRTNSVEITLDNPGGENGERLLKPGMYGIAELVVDRKLGVLAAPEPALLLDNQLLARQKKDEILRKAFVIDEAGSALKRIVRLGVRKGSYYEILAGLTEGERIVVRGQHGLKDGEKVEIVGVLQPPHASTVAKPAEGSSASPAESGSKPPAEDQKR
ncbi:MAG: efflux RND transporter periplasmic adaptor subunit [Deltaproteobacteria bacterium]|nr:efflux RND transporter periplasmic adaptor subunit [Deltaproteobacteria bacterium]